jgi:hypothetical protein
MSSFFSLTDETSRPPRQLRSFHARALLPAVRATTFIGLPAKQSMRQFTTVQHHHAAGVASLPHYHRASCPKAWALSQLGRVAVGRQ